MKYIRTKDRVFKAKEEFCKGYYDKFGHPVFFKDVINQFDTIEELCDVVVYVKEGYTNSVEHIKDFQNRNKKLFDKDLIVYGAIWTIGETGEPILKSVARLSNDRTDWKLL